MKEQFRNKSFRKKSLVLLYQAQEIIEEYLAQSIKMTLRQLYYQLVSRGYIANKASEYNKLSRLITDARYCGDIDWRAIEDRVRIPQKHSEFDNVADLIECAKASYRLDRWENQEYYVELFTEKDALSSVLYPITNKWHIYFNVNRGYSSASAMYDASKRFIEVQDEKETVLLYLGDHDPSGLDMVRDIKERLYEFGVSDLELIHIALTMEQIKKYNPPPNPAKMTDPRGEWYMERYGGASWEVDALRPEILNTLVEGFVAKFVDIDLMKKIMNKEKQDMRKLEKFVEGL